MEKRNYGIDFLRILSMFMAVILHILGRGGMLENIEPLSGNYWIAWFLEIVSYCAVNCFALISGYVMCKSKAKVSRAVELWLQTVFYTVIIAAIFFIISSENISLGDIMKSIFPITYNHYWYISAYFGMYLLVPLLNTVIQNIGKKLFEFSLVAIFLLFSVLPTVLRTDPYILNGGYSMMWLALLYLVGGYIKNMDVICKFKGAVPWLLFAVMIIITLGTKLVLEYGLLFVLGRYRSANVLVSYVSPTIVLAGVFLFIACAKLSFPRFVNKAISLFAPAALGVYLIHVNVFVWNNVIHDFAKSFTNHNAVIMVLLIFASAFIIYFSCSFIELLRIRLFKLLRIKNLCIAFEGFVAKTAESIYRRFEK